MGEAKLDVLLAIVTAARSEGLDQVIADLEGERESFA
jgi:hypothetical protein